MADKKYNPPSKNVKNPLFSNVFTNLPVEEFTQGVQLVPPPKENDNLLTKGISGEVDSFLGQDEAQLEPVPFLIGGDSLSLNPPPRQITENQKDQSKPPGDTFQAKAGGDHGKSTSVTHFPLIPPFQVGVCDPSPYEAFNQIPLENTVPLYNPNDFNTASTAQPRKPFHSHLAATTPTLEPISKSPSDSRASPTSSLPPPLTNPAVSHLTKNISTCSPSLVIDSGPPLNSVSLSHPPSLSQSTSSLSVLLLPVSSSKSHDLNYSTVPSALIPPSNSVSEGVLSEPKFDSSDSTPSLTLKENSSLPSLTTYFSSDLKSDKPNTFVNTFQTSNLHHPILSKKYPSQTSLPPTSILSQNTTVPGSTATTSYLPPKILPAPLFPPPVPQSVSSVDPPLTGESFTLYSPKSLPQETPATLASVTLDQSYVQTPLSDAIDSSKISLFSSYQEPSQPSAISSSTGILPKFLSPLQSYFSPSFTPKTEVKDSVEETGNSSSLIETNFSSISNSENSSFTVKTTTPQSQPKTDSVISETVNPLPPPPLKGFQVASSSPFSLVNQRKAIVSSSLQNTTQSLLCPNSGSVPSPIFTSASSESISHSPIPSLPAPVSSTSTVLFPQKPPLIHSDLISQPPKQIPLITSQVIPSPSTAFTPVSSQFSPISQVSENCDTVFSASLPSIDSGNELNIVKTSSPSKDTFNSSVDLSNSSQVHPLLPSSLFSAQNSLTPCENSQTSVESSSVFQNPLNTSTLADNSVSESKLPTAAISEPPLLTSSDTFSPSSSSITPPPPSNITPPPPSSIILPPPSSSLFLPPTSSSTFLPPISNSILPPPTSSSIFPPPTSSSTFCPPSTSSTFPPPTSSSIFPPPTSSSTFPPPTSSSIFPPPSSSNTFPPPLSSKIFPTPTSSCTFPLPTSTSVFPPTTSNSILSSQSLSCDSTPSKSNNNIPPPTSSSNFAPPAVSGIFPPPSSTLIPSSSSSNIIFPPPPSNNIFPLSSSIENQEFQNSNTAAPPPKTLLNSSSYRLSNLKRPTYAPVPDLGVSSRNSSSTMDDSKNTPSHQEVLKPSGSHMDTSSNSNAPPRMIDSPPPVPPSFTAMAHGQVYRPVYHHWFYKKGGEMKSSWVPFSMADSLNLEQEFTSNEVNSDTIVATDGGRYDVEVFNRKRVAVYWEEPPSEVRRCSWFVRGPVDSRYVPYDENISNLLEEEYKQACTKNEWNRRVELADGEVIIIHSPNAIAHHQRSSSPDPWGNPPPMQQKPRVVKRGLDEFDIPEGEPTQVDHLLLIVHGIGKVCDLRFRSLVEVVDDFRTISVALVQSHYKTGVETGKVGRVEVLPVEWHRALHTEAIDQRLADITLPSIPRARQFTNETLLDILFYTSPVFCERIVQAVGAELNRVFSLYLKRNPGYKGGVSLGGHSLGSLILFDTLCHQRPAHKLLRSPSISFEEGDEDVPSYGCLKTRARLSRKMSYLTIGSAGTGQPFIDYPQLMFQPRAFFALGSPIGMFVTVRGIESLGEDFKFPTCPSFFNIFHPNDPVAYRIEGLISPDMASHPAVLIPHHKGRKRMHLELKETMVHVTAALKQKLMDSVRSTWNTFYQLAMFHKHDEKAIENEVDKVIEDEMLVKETQEDDTSENETAGLDLKVGMLNGGRRIDYVLQESPLETFNQYISAIRSHVVYWESEDTSLMILKEIYEAKGITPDSQVVQPILPFDMSPEENADPGIAYEHFTVSPNLPPSIQESSFSRQNTVSE